MGLQTEEKAHLARWEKPPCHLKLPEDEVHVWRASLEAPAIRIAGLKRILSEDEVARALRYRLKRDRRRFTVGRGLLRTILSRYLGTNPSELVFSYGRYGKPALVRQCNYCDLRFNVAHSGALILYAIACNREVGVDIEDRCRLVDIELIIRRNCSEQEKRAFRAVPEELKREAFFNCWTRKEAYIKARGEGLAAHLSRITVSLMPGEPPLLLDTPAGAEEAARWSMQDIKVGARYVATVIAEGHNWKVRHWDWSW